MSTIYYLSSMISQPTTTEDRTEKELAKNTNSIALGTNRDKKGAVYFV
jgi:hypothetical protein